MQLGWNMTFLVAILVLVTATNIYSLFRLGDCYVGALSDSFGQVRPQLSALNCLPSTVNCLPLTVCP